MLGIAFDRTDQQKLASELQLAKQQAEEAHQMKKQWLANLRHDVRTPLTGILGFAKIIGQETQDSKVKDYTDNLMAAAQALLALFNRLLDSVKFLLGKCPFCGASLPANKPLHR